MESLNLDLLPDEAKKEVIDFFETICEKYKIKSNQNINLSNDIDSFFSQFNFEPVKFDREEANAR